MSIFEKYDKIVCKICHSLLCEQNQPYVLKCCPNLTVCDNCTKGISARGKCRVCATTLKCDRCSRFNVMVSLIDSNCFDCKIFRIRNVTLQGLKDEYISKGYFQNSDVLKTKICIGLINDTAPKDFF
jgi:hypothetical protein